MGEIALNGLRMSERVEEGPEAKQQMDKILPFAGAEQPGQLVKQSKQIA